MARMAINRANYTISFVCCQFNCLSSHSFHTPARFLSNPPVVFQRNVAASVAASIATSVTSIPLLRVTPVLFPFPFSLGVC